LKQEGDAKTQDLQLIYLFIAMTNHWVCLCCTAAPRLCDFGFAKAWAANSNMDTMRIGTPEYMGPELISGRCVAVGAVLLPLL